MLMEDMLTARFTGTGKKSRCPTRIIGGTFPAFVGNLYRRGDSRQMGKAS